MITLKNLPLNCNAYTTTNRNSHSVRSYFGVWHCVCGTSGIHILHWKMCAQEENEFRVILCVCAHECIQVHVFERACVCANLHV